MLSVINGDVILVFTCFQRNLPTISIVWHPSFMARWCSLGILESWERVNRKPINSFEKIKRANLKGKMVKNIYGVQLILIYSCGNVHSNIINKYQIQVFLVKTTFMPVTLILDFWGSLFNHWDNNIIDLSVIYYGVNGYCLVSQENYLPLPSFGILIG